MSACEKCWRDSRYSEFGSGPKYHELIEERRAAGNICTPEEQAGPYAKPCEKCNGRLVRHQLTGECMADRSHGTLVGRRATDS